MNRSDHPALRIVVMIAVQQPALEYVFTARIGCRRARRSSSVPQDFAPSERDNALTCFCASCRARQRAWLPLRVAPGTA
jgi:hypothetical protein